MKIKIILLAFFITCTFGTKMNAQSTVSLPLLAGEQWWGGAGQFGYKMPFNEKSDFKFNLLGDSSQNQSVSLLLSNKGRWIWCDAPFSYAFKNNSLTLHSDSAEIQSGVAGKNLATAYAYASQHYFPASGNWPDPLLITAPQYNLWIELQYNPNQKDVLQYATDVLKQGLPAGVLMIDDNWSNYYGEFDFNRKRFPDARQAIAKLHEQGFKVMLWISPFISPDSEVFRELQEKKLMLLDNDGNAKKDWNTTQKPLLIEWWNGYSACLDLTNPKTQKWLTEKLQFLQKEYGVDGFKFDAGDAYFYNSTKLVSFRKATPNEHSEEWAKIGLSFPLNEYRAMWKMGGQPLVQRLADKSHSWKDLQMLVPNTIAQQLLGYTFTCPDMIGGGSFGSFLPGAKINQKLIVRSAQVHALMPMMQFSVAPWRILDTEHLNATKEVVALRQKMMPELMAILKDGAVTGEPVLRPLEYNYPNQGFENIKDEFMLGTNILVAPVVTEEDERTIVLPKGNWFYQNKKWQGGKTYVIKVALNELPVFIKK
ncbi:glycoside hydrolase [Flavobacterium rhamnosiphilum]|uniref:Glycoside hydrolase n=2 Tax=Flavobacterium rhamnosiphilum TaxID=2541724 RepID=A0A4R5FAN1_9FLAO|nr:glycoside hydrolase [Flavobacterium rhamnosiphilum]